MRGLVPALHSCFYERNKEVIRTQKHLNSRTAQNRCATDGQAWNSRFYTHFINSWATGFQQNLT